MLATTDALPSVRQHAQTTIIELFEFLRAQGDTDYMGERVSQLQHSLQAAQLAYNSSADNDTILAALLHDVGRFIPVASEMPALIAPDGQHVGIADHEVLGERYLRQIGFSEKICQLVGAHVMAKRFLTAVDKNYYDSLSPLSKKSLKFQGGTFTNAQAEEAEKDPYIKEKVAVRRWDDMAKDPTMKTLPLEYFRPIATESLIRSRAAIVSRGRSYFLPTKAAALIVVHGPATAKYKTHEQEDALSGSANQQVSALLDQFSIRGVRVATLTNREKRFDVPTETLATMNLCDGPLHLLDRGVELLEKDLADVIYVTVSALSEVRFEEFMCDVASEAKKMEDLGAKVVIGIRGCPSLKDEGKAIRLTSDFEVLASAFS
ncbi:uncharacterized protein Z519_07746 [Cladophialophora bantiana CBS 173.52]|uniref:HD domain-containing protein n=1 Tax=Cladophialophora bantiana (strain ATCC 10958 / CBS 173.52 / CDC B-1940 / NIH 8579) TaxID=1442370 RepID=A0A0D2EP63_CLAB1|nr:uncharacterized protein Z519_07746 [Cladophialophora bantiana CBS 173.52]KIW91776.1 hypothetical protein Z519_07746 [Cladophialophora bantiana CBS 173.52]